ncbi:hypothetical protein [Ralstonia phage RSF1]|uniref:DUF1353 domain-containing protein n=1 Tax=Ralstonia phage RSF1 TaxID=1689679 RepID=A0A0K2QQU0_9CAUD|nr:tail assembly chaperone [Ralstonia phage RSF1]BAS04959.2 hypothetical protein [Ralstonia phage RSF1]
MTGSFDQEVGIRYSAIQSKLKDKDLWFTDDAFTFYIGETEEQKYVTVPDGFFTDGATVPRMLWWLFPPWGVYGQAAVLHDYLCQNLRLTKNGDNPDLKLTQTEVDKIFELAMKVLGTPWIKRKIMYWAVHIYHSL